MYVVVKKGMYIQGFSMPFESVREAHAFAKEIAEQQVDNYHEILVVVCSKWNDPSFEKTVAVYRGSRKPVET